MSRRWKFTDKDGLYFVSYAVVSWVDVFVSTPKIRQFKRKQTHLLYSIFETSLTSASCSAIDFATIQNQYLCSMKRRHHLSHGIISAMLLVLFCCMLYSCGNREQHKGIRVLIETKFGDIEAELYPDKAPATVAAFLRNVDSGYYRNTSFYRILRDDNQVTGAPHSHLIQGGLWEASPALERRLPLIPHEPTSKTGLRHVAGALSMARNTPGTASSEFFICLKEEPGFDYGGENNPDGAGYAVFGKVVSGVETVQEIYRQPQYEQQFTPAVTILDIKRLD